MVIIDLEFANDMGYVEKEEEEELEFDEVKRLLDSNDYHYFMVRTKQTGTIYLFVETAITNELLRMIFVKGDDQTQSSSPRLLKVDSVFNSTGLDGMIQRMMRDLITLCQYDLFEENMGTRVFK